MLMAGNPSTGAKRLTSVVRVFMMEMNCDSLCAMERLTAHLPTPPGKMIFCIFSQVVAGSKLDPAWEGVCPTCRETGPRARSMPWGPECSSRICFGAHRFATVRIAACRTDRDLHLPDETR